MQGRRSSKLTHGTERHGHGCPVDGAYERHQRAEPDHHLPAGWLAFALLCRCCCCSAATGDALKDFDLRGRQSDDLSLRELLIAVLKRLVAVLKLLSVPCKAPEGCVRPGGGGGVSSSRNDDALSETSQATAGPAGENITRPSASSRVGPKDQGCRPAEDRRHGVIELEPCARRTAVLCCRLPSSSSSQLSIETYRSSVAVRLAWVETVRGLKSTSGSCWAVRACGCLLGCAAVHRSGPRIRPLGW